MKKLTLTALFAVLNFIAFSQNANEIRFLTEPKESRGYLVWTKAPTSLYILKVFEKTTDGNGVEQSKLIHKQVLRQNFYHFEDSYIKRGDIYYQVEVIDGVGTVVYNTDEVPICVGCEQLYWTAGWWTCLSQLYAYNIVMDLPLNSQGYGFLRLDKAGHYSSQNAFGTSMLVPYYEAMTPTVFQARTDAYNYYYEGIYAPFHLNPANGQNIHWYMRNDVLASENIKDAQNNVLTGQVFFVGKALMQFKPNENHYSNPCVYESDFGNGIQWFINTYELATPSAPVTMECSEYGFAGGPSADDIDIEEVDWDEVFDSPWDVEWVNDCFGSVFQSNMLYVMNYLEEPCDYATNPSAGLEYAEAIQNILSIQVSSLTNGSFPVVNLDPSTVIPSPGVPFVSHNTQFETGVYILRFFFGDGSSYTTIVEHDAQTHPIINNASFATVSIVPNPVVDEWLNVDIAVERFMAFDLEVITLNGDVIFTENIRMEEDTEARKSIRLPNQDFPSNQLIVRMKFQDGSTLQQTALVNN